MAVTDRVNAPDKEASALQLSGSPDPGEGEFFALRTIQQIMESQRVQPLQYVCTLAGVILDEELDSFVAEIYAARERA